MVGCSENNINFLDHKLLTHFCTLLASGYTITPFSYFFESLIGLK